MDEDVEEGYGAVERGVFKSVGEVVSEVVGEGVRKVSA